MNSTTSSDSEAADVVNLLRLAVEQAPQGVLVLNQSGAIAVANQSAHTIFGYASGELVGRTLDVLIPGLGDATAQIITGVRKDGVPVPLEVGRSVTTSGDTQYGVVSIADLTDLVDMRARLTAATDAHLGFQRLVADIALRFAGAEGTALDDLIRKSLRQIGETLRMDRAVLWRRNAGEPVAVATHYWTTHDDPTPPQGLSLASIPHVVAQLEAGYVRVLLAPRRHPRSDRSGNVRSTRCTVGRPRTARHGRRAGRPPGSRVRLDDRRAGMGTRDHGAAAPGRRRHQPGARAAHERGVALGGGQRDPPAARSPRRSSPRTCAASRARRNRPG